METSQPKSKETVTSLEEVYSFIANLESKLLTRWLTIFAIIIAIILIVSSLVIFNKIRNNLPIISTMTKLETAILFSGFFSALLLFIFVLFLFYSFLIQAIKIIGKFLGNVYHRLIVDPIARLFEIFLQWITKTRIWKLSLGLGQAIWKLPFNLGNDVGYKYILYPAIPALEPETDRKTIKRTTLEQLSPDAYRDELVCKAILERYYDFFPRISPLFLLIWLGFFIISSIPIKLLNLVTYLIGFLPAPLSSLEAVVFLAGFIVIGISWPAFMWGTITPFLERRRAWEMCTYQLLRKHELEEQAKDITNNISGQLQVGIEKLRHLYASEHKLTQDAREEREEAERRLKHLVEHPGMDEQRIKDVIWFVEFGLDQRRREDTAIQEKKAKKERWIGFIIGVSSSIVAAGVIEFLKVSS